VLLIRPKKRGGLRSVGQDNGGSGGSVLRARLRRQEIGSGSSSRIRGASAPDDVRKRDSVRPFRVPRTIAGRALFQTV